MLPSSARRMYREIAEAHVFSKGRVCGIYKKKQLEINVPTNPRRKPNSIVIGILGLLYSTNMNAQEKVDTVKTEQIQIDRKYQNHEKIDLKDNSVKESIIVSGTIFDEFGEVLLFANVHLKESKIGTTTNLDGFYSIEISEQLELQNEVILVFTYVGYITKEILVSKDQILNNRKTIDVSLYQGEITDFVVYQLPLHKRIWNGIKRVIRKKN